MKISKYKVGPRRFVAFVDDYEIPTRPLANAFIYDVYINASFSTKVRAAQDLKIVLEYFDFIRINLESIVASGKLLTNQDISKFYELQK